MVGVPCFSIVRPFRPVKRILGVEIRARLSQATRGRSTRRRCRLLASAGRSKETARRQSRSCLSNSAGRLPSKSGSAMCARGSRPPRRRTGRRTCRTPDESWRHPHALFVGRFSDKLKRLAWPAHSVSHIDTCGVRFPRRLSDADSLKQPAAAMISASGTVPSLGRMSGEIPYVSLLSDPGD